MGALLSRLEEVRAVTAMAAVSSLARGEECESR